MIIATERFARPRLLDPVEAALWNCFDGDVEIDELVDDLADALERDRTFVHARVCSFVSQLHVAGFLADGSPRDLADARRVLVPVPPDSCLGRKMGLARAPLTQLTTPEGGVLRVGCTDDVWLQRALGRLPGRIDQGDPTGVLAPTLVLREAAGRVNRTSQLIDSGGGTLFAARDEVSPREALGRSIAGVLTAPASPDLWVDGPALLFCTDGADDVVLVHPALHPLVSSAAFRKALAARGGSLVPAAMMAVTFADSAAGAAPSATAVLPPDWLGEEGERGCRLRAILVPESGSTATRLGLLIHLAHRWTGPQLQLMARLDGAVEQRTVSDRETDEQIMATMLAGWGE